MRDGDPPDDADLPATALVTGEIVIAGGAAPLAGATAHVRLEDVSFADAPARIVAEVVIPGVHHSPTGGEGATVIGFALAAPPGAPPIDPASDYAVRVWIDHDGDGQPGPGDLYSDQSHRVLTRGFGRTATITLGRSSPTTDVHRGETDEQR